MWRPCHSLLCRYLFLIVAFIGCFEIQVSASKTNHALAEPQAHNAEDIRASQVTTPRSFRRQIENVSEPERGQVYPQDTGSLPNMYNKPAFNLYGTDLTPALPQYVTNGNSVLGTRQTRKYRRHFFDDLGFEDSQATNTSATTLSTGESPVTGATRRYTFDVNYTEIAPDGITRQSILINGAFPGPTIEANYGDWVEVVVKNSMADDGTTIHWHGLLQKETPWMDGVPSVHQCPIAPGQSFTYLFRADQVGTTWWHSHFSGQYTSGAYGALIIKGETEDYDYDEDLGPVFLSDWYHQPLDDALQTTMHSENSQPPPADNLLINGKMNFQCDTTSQPCVPNAGVSKFFFNPGKKYRLRLINSGAGTNAKFSIDGHTFTVVAQDFTPLVPYQTDLISLANGQRSDVIVEAVGTPGSSYWMRYDLGDGNEQDACIGANSANVRTAVAAVYYDGADENSVPATTSSIDPARLYPCANDPLSQTVPAEVISSEPRGELITIEMHINFNHQTTPTVLNSWTINDASYRANFSRALLSDVHAGTANDAEDQIGLFDFGNNGTVRIIMYDHFEYTHHPMHLHGYNFQVLAEGWGVWDGTITNPENPSRRDVHVLDKARFTDGPSEPAYTVIQFFTDNPGIWPLHCHLAWHNSAGLFANLLVKSADVQSLEIPDEISRTCVDWNNFLGEVDYEQLDAGI